MPRIAVVGVAGGWSSERLADALEAKTGFRRIIDPARLRTDLATGRAIYEDLNLEELDGLIIKKLGPAYSPDLLDRLEILRFLHQRGLPMFSPPESILRVLDRLSCTVTLTLNGIPMPHTVITESIEEAAQAIGELGQAVLKPLYSTKARGMRLIADTPHIMDELAEYRAEGNKTIYLQKRLDLPGRDLGVVFLGGKYLATYARTKTNGAWNTTTRSGGKYQACEPGQEIIDLATRAQAPFNLDFTCVDVAETERGLVVFEVSAFGGFRGLKEGNDLDAADLYASYVLEKIA